MRIQVGHGPRDCTPDWILLPELGDEHIDIRLCGRRRDPGTEATHDRERVAPDPRDDGRKRQEKIDADSGREHRTEVEVGRQDPDDGRWTEVETQRLSDEGPVARKTTLPQYVAEHEGRRG